MRCAFVEGSSIEDIRLTCAGRDYLAVNPKLRNPVDWEIIIMTITIDNNMVYMTKEF